MLKTVMNVPGDSFEERWATLDERVREHCEERGTPYPKETLELTRRWFASVGDWFDQAFPNLKGRHPGIEAPGEEDPALVLLREFDWLLSYYAEQSDGVSGLNHRSGLPEPYRHPVGTLCYANDRLLEVIQDEDYGVSLRRGAIAAVAELMDLSGAPLYRERFEMVKERLQERADREGKDPETVLGEALEEALWAQFGTFVRAHRTTGLFSPPSTARANPLEEVDESDAVDITALIMENIIPGNVAPDIRPEVNNWITDTLLGPGWRDQERKPKTEFKMRELAKNMMGRPPDPERKALSKLIPKDPRTHDVLTERQQEVLKLLCVEHWTAEEIADEFEIALSTVRSHFSDALERIQEVGA